MTFVSSHFKKMYVNLKSLSKLLGYIYICMYIYSQTYINTHTYKGYITAKHKQLSMDVLQTEDTERKDRMRSND